MKDFFAIFLFMFVAQCSLLAQDTTVADSAEVQEIPAFVEVIPKFPGGDSAMTIYFQNNLKYPKKERRSGKQGIVYVKFTVGKDGSISEVTTIKGVENAPGLSREAERLVREMPNWLPGTINGRPVRYEMTLPIKFTLT